MGFLDKLFSKERPNNLENFLPIQTGHKEQWEIYMTNIDNKIGSIIVDLGLREIAPIQELPNIIWITIKMNNPRDNGLTSSKEDEPLTNIENKLVTSITSNFKSIYVGRTVSDGNIDLYFYLGDTLQYDKAISKVMTSFPTYSFEFGSNEDKHWKVYLDFLYPVPEQMQSIENRHIVEELKKNGDKLIKPRAVDHWIYFKDANDREIFQSKIKDEGFSTVNVEFDKTLGKLPYKLHIRRIDKVDWNSVDQYTIHLWRLAGECNGEYDGWETQVLKD